MNFHIEGRFFGHRRRPTMVGRAAASHSAVSANNQQQNSRKDQRHNAESFEAWQKNVLASSNNDPRGREAFESLVSSNRHTCTFVRVLAASGHSSCYKVNKSPNSFVALNLTARNNLPDKSTPDLHTMPPQSTRIMEGLRISSLAC